MKHVIITFLAALSFSCVNAQIDIIERSPKKQITPTTYNGEFPTFKQVFDLSEKAGTVGEQVTLLQVSTNNIFLSETDRINYNNVSDNLKSEFKNQTFTIIDYRNDIYDILTIQKDSVQYIWQVSSFDQYIFNKFIDTLASRMVNKVFVPLHMNSELVSLNGSKIRFDGNQEYKITGLNYGKINYDYTGEINYNYTFIVTINDSIEAIYSSDPYDQPRVFNGKSYTNHKDYINIKSVDILGGSVTLVEKNEFASFAIENSEYLKPIRNGEVTIGMSEKHCRLALGMPTMARNNIEGYDKLLFYGTPDSAKYLYFNEDILVFMK